MNKLISFTATALLLANGVIAQKNRDKAVFSPPLSSSYFSTIQKETEKFKVSQNPPPANLRFEANFSAKTYPNKISDYNRQIWHNKPVSQGITGTCWCFCATSFFESEVNRITAKTVKLSEMFTVYYEYIEKARGFVRSRGTSAFGEGSESNAVTRSYKTNGIVPRSVYDGLKKGRKFYDHTAMFAEMANYLNSVKASNTWNEETVISTIKSILNFYMGEPPTEFEFEGKKYTPKEYLASLKINPDDYVDLVSYMQQPFNQQVEYEVPDNWWHSKDYYNLPVEDFMKVLKKGVLAGYSFDIGGDVSEAGLSRTEQVGIIPTFDIPSEYIDDAARQFRFSNGTTTDDHGMHIVGLKETKDSGTWYLVKDSGAGSKNKGEGSPEYGYYFFHEDYIKLKMMTFMVHKDAVKDFIKNK